jgi:hypothetical protein
MPIYSVREKYEFYKQNLRKYSTNPFRVEENKTKLKNLFRNRKPGSIVFLEDKLVNGTNNRKSHPYVITDVKDGNIVVHQITTTPPKFIKASSLRDVVNNRESYVKLEQVDKTHDGRKISYFDAYITNSKKISSSDYTKLIQKKNEYSKKRK